eukprot:PhM_4_TR503/c0_g1_i2/m.101765
MSQQKCAASATTTAATPGAAVARNQHTSRFASLSTMPHDDFGRVLTTPVQKPKPTPTSRSTTSCSPESPCIPRAPSVTTPGLAGGRASVASRPTSPSLPATPIIMMSGTDLPAIPNEEGAASVTPTKMAAELMT